MSRKQPSHVESTASAPSESGRAGDGAVSSKSISITVDGVSITPSPALLAAITAELGGRPAAPPNRTVKRHLRCPICYDNYGGVAARRKWQRQVSGPLQKRCYVCGECGTEWVADVRLEIVDDIEIRTTQIVEVRPSA